MSSNDWTVARCFNLVHAMRAIMLGGRRLRYKEHLDQARDEMAILASMALSGVEVSKVNSFGEIEELYLLPDHKCTIVPAGQTMTVGRPILQTGGTEI